MHTIIIIEISDKKTCIFVGKLATKKKLFVELIESHIKSSKVQMLEIGNIFAKAHTSEPIYSAKIIEAYSNDMQQNLFKLKTIGQH